MNNLRFEPLNLLAFSLSPTGGEGGVRGRRTIFPLPAALSSKNERIILGNWNQNRN